MMSLDYLKTFKEFVECGSMVAAAKKLSMTQPGVTLQLKKLQEQLPNPLFVQNGKRKN